MRTGQWRTAIHAQKSDNVAWQRSSAQLRELTLVLLLTYGEYYFTDLVMSRPGPTPELVSMECRLPGDGVWSLMLGFDFVRFTDEPTRDKQKGSDECGVSPAWV